MLLGAADTFRAAAVEQLEVWAAARRRARSSRARRTQTRERWPSTRSRQARRDGADVVIIDTAGRLHTQDDLMAELAKVRRVIAQPDPRARRTRRCSPSTRPPARTGCARRKLFSEAVDVTGLVLTKLDGTAKGGIALAIAHELGIPVKLIGVGEQLEDLRPFDPDRFRPRAGHLSGLIWPGRRCRERKVACKCQVRSCG